MNIIVDKPSRRPPRLALAVGAAALLLTAACGSSGSGHGPQELRVVASTDVYGDIVRQIAGDQVRVTSLITDPAVDPHSYEATTQNRLELSKADVVIENGGGYDDFVHTMLRSSDSTATVLDAVDLSGRTASAGGRLNEHVWYDFPAMQKLADRLVSVLSSADPAHAPAFRAGGDAFRNQLQRLEGIEAAIERAHDGDGAAVTEPVPLYVLEACGLRNKTPAEFSEAIEEGSDVSPAVLQRTLDLFTDKQVAVLAYNEQTSGPETEKVLAAAGANGIAVVPVTETLPGGQDYVSWMTGILTGLQTALG